MTKTVQPVRRDATDLETRAVGERQVRVVISTRNKDRHGDVVIPRGIDLEPYKANPVVLWNHNWNEPIARATDLQVDDDRVVATVQFPEEGISQSSDEAYGRIKAGIINAASIGFMPKEWHWEDDGAGGETWVVDKSELYEFSFVTIPSNRESLIMERALKHEDGSITLSVEDQAELFRRNMALLSLCRDTPAGDPPLELKDGADAESAFNPEPAAADDEVFVPPKQIGAPAEVRRRLANVRVALAKRRRTH